MPTLETYNGYPLWHYVPSIVGSIIFTVLFAAATTIHLWRMLNTRAWYFVPFCIGGSLEVIGYLGRTIAYNKTGELAPYIIQSIFTLQGPVLLSATVYMMLSRVITLTDGEAHSLIRARWITRIFVLCDVLSFLTQSSGGGLMAIPGDGNLGKILIIIGLLVQIVAFVFFVLLGSIFYRRMLLLPTEQSLVFPRWATTMSLLTIVSCLILARSIFRLIEYCLGNNGYLLQHEWSTYIFDSCLMLTAMMIFACWYPGRLRKSAEYKRQYQLSERR